MLAAVVLAALVATGPALLPPAPTAIGVVPPEPDAFFLPEAPTYQAVAADLDGDGTREVVRLVQGDRGSISVEAWTDAPEGWVMPGGAIQVVPGQPTGGQAEVVYAGTPIRLLVRRTGDSERVTLLRHPRFQEPEIEPGCCLLLDDLVLGDDGLRLVSVAEPGSEAMAVLVIDLDGDGTDELLVSRSLPPLGDISFPSEVRVYRWTGVAFAPPTVTELPVGSGDAPFLLGDSDGEPGEEVGIIPSSGPPSLHRVSLVEGDRVDVEDSDLIAADAVAVPLEADRGVAIADPGGVVTVLPWPAGGQPGAALGAASIVGADLIGTVEIGDERRLLVRQSLPATLHALLLPDLASIRATGIPRSAAAAALASAPIRSYAGLLPGGGPGGEPVAILHGRLVPGETGDDAPFPIGGAPAMASLGGSAPVGLVGRDGGWLALHHSPLRPQPVDPRGGRLDPPFVDPGSGVSLAPLASALVPEEDAGRLEPPTPEAPALDARGTLGIGGGGLRVELSAPAGSRVYLGEADPSVLGAVRVVPASARLELTIVPPAAAPGGRQRVGLAVVTPAGHAYLATWVVRLLTEAPVIRATASTPLGSPTVTIEGVTVPYVRLTVAGEPVTVDDSGHFRALVPAPPWPTDVTIVARDPVGNEATTSVSAVGIVDYRGLPWIPISVALVAVAGVVLFLRVPRPRDEPRPAGDDGRLEEMDPD